VQILEILASTSCRTTMRQFLLAGWHESTTKSTKATKGDEDVDEGFFVLFVSFVVNLSLG